MGKLGAIQSAEAFGTAAMLRNKFSHHYPEESAARIERLNLIIGLATRHRFDVAGEPCSSYIQKKRKYRHALNP